MNEKEAKKVFEKRQQSDVEASLACAGSMGDAYWFMAKGYLETIEKISPLVEALNNIVGFKVELLTAESYLQKIAKEALTKWEEIK